DMRNVIKDQAAPAMIAGRFTPLLVVGRDLGQRSFEQKRPFFASQIVAASVCTSVFNQFAAWESSEYMKVRPVSARMQAKGHLPFVDLYPTSQKFSDAQNDAVTELRTYLRAANPLVVLAFGSEVSSVALGSFQPRKTTSDFGAIVGKVVMSKYDDDPANDDDNNSVAVIACYHPGTVAHGGRMGPTWHRIIGKLLVKAWLAIHVAVCYANNNGFTKKQLCAQIISVVNAHTGPDTLFDTNLLQHVREYRTESAKSRSTRTRSDRAERRALAVLGNGFDAEIVTDASSWKAAQLELWDLIDCQIVSNQKDRTQQIASLWGGNHEFLTSNLGSRNTKASFEQWASSIPVNTFYYIALTTAEQQKVNVPNLMSCFLPASIEANQLTWKHDPAIVKTASGDMVKWLESEVMVKDEAIVETYNKAAIAFRTLLQVRDPNLSARVQKIYKARSFYDESVQHFKNNCEVFLKPSYGDTPMLHLSWLDEDNKAQKLAGLFLPASALPLFVTDKRYLELNTLGLNIRDEQSRILGIIPGAQVTMSIATIQLNLSKQNETVEHPFLKLWERVTQTSVEDALLERPSRQPATFDSSASIPGHLF
ncbi:hypothetical protein LTR66_017116, partial [Elasticomyces elasticus]